MRYQGSPGERVTDLGEFRSGKFTDWLVFSLTNLKLGAMRGGINLVTVPTRMAAVRRQDSLSVDNPLPGVHPQRAKSVESG
jgi:hypothetical protein